MPKGNARFSSLLKLLNDSGQLLAICQASMTVINIFMAVEVPLLFFIKDDSNFPKSIGSNARQVLLMLSYSGPFFTLSAAASGLILTYELVKAPAQMPQALREARPALTWVALHLMLSLVGSTTLPIAQVLFYVWLEESNSVRITLSILAVYAALPVVFLIALPSCNSKSQKHQVLEKATSEWVGTRSGGVLTTITSPELQILEEIANSK
ncbi:hypothetical protein EDB83DRAFT_2327166 [Lactarius deliciosus]|nr:hypothetical protein EDB83DRAFT_2327166 [Lactarius deliciosus]